jgi:hypothetical protein
MGGNFFFSPKALWLDISSFAGYDLRTVSNAYILFTGKLARML